MAAATWARRELRTLQEEYHEFNPPIIPRLPYALPLAFSKQVSKGLPCVFEAPCKPPTSCTDHFVSDLDSSLSRDTTFVNEYPWRALEWTVKDLTSIVTERVEVAVTPTGRADTLASLPNSSSDPERVFLEPASIELTLSELIFHLSSAEHSTPETAVYYLQSQNSNLTTTALSSLLKDLPENFAFAEKVLGEPDARNIWIGTEKSVTSVHRDPYENLYLVLKGSKTFRLWPPIDEIAMPTKLVRTGSYVYDATQNAPFDIRLNADGKKIPWIDMDPLNPEDEKMVTARGAKMRIVTVNEGEMLYLPSGWYHHVSQSCGQWKDGSIAPCIAINYWYDMDYEGEKYVLRQMVGRLVEIANPIDVSNGT